MISRLKYLHFFVQLPPLYFGYSDIFGRIMKLTNIITLPRLKYFLFYNPIISMPYGRRDSKKSKKRYIYRMYCTFLFVKGISLQPEIYALFIHTDTP